MKNNMLLVLFAGLLFLFILAGCSNGDPRPQLREPPGPSLQPGKMAPEAKSQDQAFRKRKSG
jgi:hypothetical protein